MLTLDWTMISYSTNLCGASFAYVDWNVVVWPYPSFMLPLLTMSRYRKLMSLAGLLSQLFSAPQCWYRQPQSTRLPYYKSRASISPANTNVTFVVATGNVTYIRNCASKLLWQRKHFLIMKWATISFHYN